MSFDRFYIIANRGKDPDQTVSKKIKHFLESRGKICTIAFTDKEREELHEKLCGSSDCMLVLGGDGTVLEASHLTAGTETPILGINLGNIGYLAEVNARDWEPALLRILDGGYEIESRMMLEGYVSDPISHVYPGARGQALNDIVITRNRGLKILDYNIYVDGQFLNKYSADGVIVSTATGSTAYNMSAGGPIVEPKARLILLTPISPHTFNNRSIVLSADDNIMIEMIPPRNGGELFAECDFDGTGNIELHSGDRVHVTKSEATTLLVRLSRRSFLEILHRKITS